MGSRAGTINGPALRAIRELQAPALSQDILAQRIGVSQAHLSMIEAGQRKASPDVARALAVQLGVPLAAITYPRETCPDCSRRSEQPRVAA